MSTRYSNEQEESRHHPEFHDQNIQYHVADVPPIEVRVEHPFEMAPLFNDHMIKKHGDLYHQEWHKLVAVSTHS